ncbi:helix-turn-helix domain-containing protein [Patulibacter sp. NPDC049589]|uniref:helix-turn-helix domain-containing protein n=1 Tax=Patulibacter sp. NPDC049589 TaxID=3154731 RepID=UPI003439C3F4
MADRLRDLIDLVLATLDEPGTGGEELARRASFSRDHLDRLLAAATGETPVGLRRRLLLERAAWQLRDGTSASAAADAAGYGSLAAFSRAFARAHGVPPSAFAASDLPARLDAPNGVHFHPPAGLLMPAGPGAIGDTGSVRPATGTWTTGTPAARDLTERMVLHHLDRVRELLAAARPLPDEALARPLRPGFVAVWFEGEEPSAALMAQRLVLGLEVWVAAIDGLHLPAPAIPRREWEDRFERAASAFQRIARRIRDEAAWDGAFVDALCEPPQSFTYGGVLSHVLAYGAIRREMLASVLRELGAVVPASGDPISWETGG